MPLEPLFQSFRPAIEARFAAATTDAGQHANGLGLRIEEEPHDPKSRGRAEFLVIDPVGPVRITWNGIASLWTFCQGAARVSRRMFEAKREGKKDLTIADDAELVRGVESLELARRLCTRDISEWPDWATPLVLTAAAGTDEEFGNRFFFGTLHWIFLHEIAHVALRHSERQHTDGISDQACETEADLGATRWLRGNRRADQDRRVGTRPSEPELQLEGRALSVGLGLIWVALFEADRGQRNATHPPVADRLFACLDELNLREDSAAAEILSDIVQAWIAPEDNWAPAGGHPTAHNAIAEAVFRLHRHLS